MEFLFINLIIIFSLYMYCKLSKGNMSLLTLLISLTLTGNTDIISGLKYIDIISVLIFIINFKRIKNLKIISISLLTLMCYQIFLNCILYSIGNFKGNLANCIIPVIHEYLPYILIFLVFENIKLTFKDVYINYQKFLSLISIITILIVIYLQITGGLATMKSISTVVGISGLISFVSPIWIYVALKNKSPLKSLINVFFLTTLVIYLSEVRGALMIYGVLCLGVIFLNIKKKAFIMLLPLMTIIGIFIIKLFKQSEDIMSIIVLQKTLLFNLLPDFSLMSSSETLRYYLWTTAKDIWFNNFLFGIGTNQFKELEILNNVEKQLSPHHAIYSLTTAGGIIALILIITPLFVYLINQKSTYFFNEKNHIFYWLKICCLLYLTMAYLFGYTFEIYHLFAFLLINNNKIAREGKKNEKGSYVNLH